MRRWGMGFAVLFAWWLAGGAPVPAADRPSRMALDYSAYDGWNAIRTPKLSDDGRYLAYALTPDYGDPTLVVRDLTNGAERRVARGDTPLFTADGKFVIYTIAPEHAAVEAAKKAKKPAAEQPKNGLGILELATGRGETFERVKSVRVARDGGRFIAFLHDVPMPNASPTPGASPSPSRLPAPSASPAPTAPSPSPSPNDIKKKDDGAVLEIRDLHSGTGSNVAGVSDYALADDDAHVAYAVQTRGGTADGVYVRDLAAASTAAVLAGNARYKGVTISRDGKHLAFVSDVRSYADAAPRFDAYVATLGTPSSPAMLAVESHTPGLPPGQSPNENGTLTFSRDGARLYFGTAAVPTPLPSNTPAPVAVDLWTYRDERLQSQQMHDAPDDRKRTYRAVYDLPQRRFAQLGSARLQRIETNENPAVALGLDAHPYAVESSWTGDDAADAYAVSLRDGARRLLARRALDTTLSPGGAYVLTWDRRLRHWLAIRTADGRRTVLGAAANVAFYDETDDHPGPPPPYGSGGWIEGDRGVILYDRYDPWLVDPATGRATNLCRGAGRAALTVYSVLQIDPERAAYAAGRPFLLSFTDRRTYASGFARVAFAGGRPQTLLRTDRSVNAVPGASGLRDRIAPPLRARAAERVVFSQESFREFRDLWSSDLSFAHPQLVTLANPQLANYRWGTEELIDYRTRRGAPLRAVLLTPDNFDPHRKYPMLVYFYEKYSDQFHTFYSPVPRYPTIARYVSNGYVVLLPDVTYRVGHPGQSALECILAGVDAVTRRGFIDQARIGIAGHSWAGYQINYMLTRTDRFRAAEAGAAVADMPSAYGGIRLESGVVREFQYEAGQSRIGAAPWDRPDLYLENSGLFHIRNVHTPYLSMHNDADTAVPFEQGVEFITAMRRLGKPAYMFVFNGKEHNLRDTPADRDDLIFWAVHFDEWFDYWLKGSARPSWFDGVDYLHRGQRDVRPRFGEAP